MIEHAGCAVVALILCPAKLSVKEYFPDSFHVGPPAAERQIEWMTTRGFALAQSLARVCNA
jgi:hypothetical protein